MYIYVLSTPQISHISHISPIYIPCICHLLLVKISAAAQCSCLQHNVHVQKRGCMHIACCKREHLLFAKKSMRRNYTGCSAPIFPICPLNCRTDGSDLVLHCGNGLHDLLLLTRQPVDLVRQLLHHLHHFLVHRVCVSFSCIMARGRNIGWWTWWRWWWSRTMARGRNTPA